MTTTTANHEAQSNPVAFFVSDLHLQIDMPKTTAAFLAFLKLHASDAQQLYLLGDIFEYWAGDDDLHSPFLQKIVAALREVSDCGVELFWMAGNRDFLVGQEFARTTGATLLADPHCLTYAGHRYVLTHGDQLCTDDVSYQQFRSMVRKPDWQSAFLARSLEERKNIIATMREHSQQHQRHQPTAITDVNQAAVNQFFVDQNSTTIIHGHTHRPAEHHVGNTTRTVLSDWDQDNAPLRGDWLALLPDGCLQRYEWRGSAAKE